LFDGQVMAQAGMFEHVPVYTDTTIEPYTELYVPLGRWRMRVYERRRDSELAVTTGRHLPTFPVESPSVQPTDRPVFSTDEMRSREAVGTGGSFRPRLASDAASTVVPQRMSEKKRSIATRIPHSATDGIWLEFNGSRCHSSGPAVSFSPDRFEPMGEYRGFPVYRDTPGGNDEIWVSVVKDGPLAPYKKP
jgi:hypothetical protein